MSKAIHFHSTTGVLRLNQRKLLREWIISISQSKNRVCGDISYIFCNDDYLHDINKRYLKHDDFTDIITFDYSDNERISGDIFISTERVKDNSEKFNSEYTNELHRVMAHGVLHLLGYKDKKATEKKLMTDAEDYWLNKRPKGLNVPRGTVKK